MHIHVRGTGRPPSLTLMRFKYLLSFYTHFVTLLSAVFPLSFCGVWRPRDDLPAAAPLNWCAFYVFFLSAVFKRDILALVIYVFYVYICVSYVVAVWRLRWGKMEKEGQGETWDRRQRDGIECCSEALLVYSTRHRADFTVLLSIFVSFSTKVYSVMANFK